MTMYYHRRSNRIQAIPIGLSILLISFAALIFFSNQTFFTGISSFFNPITAPLFRFGSSVSNTANNLFPFFKTNKALIDENKTLKNSLSDANEKLLTYELLVEENKELKASSSRTTSLPEVLAVVLAKPSRSPYDTLILDVGLREGITLGDIVNAFETIAIGTIAEVSSHTSKAALFSAPGKKTLVRLEKAHITREIIGQGGGMFLFTIPRDIAITRGEMLTLAGLNQKVVGVVVNVETFPNDSFQTVTAKLPINIFELERVFISHESTFANTN